MPTVIDVGALGSRGFLIQGDAADDRAGQSVTAIGDFNGDGFDDFAVGAPFNDAGANAAGRTYIIYGHGGAFPTLDLTNFQASDGVILTGPTTFAGTGWDISGAGDVNGDGFDDVLIGGFGRTAYLVFGRATGAAAVDLANLAPPAGIKLDTPFSFYASTTVDDAGDVNGDGFDDFLVGATHAHGYRGSTYVVFGKASGFSNLDLTQLPAGAGYEISGTNSNAPIGFSESAIGDINGDGFDDIIVSSYLDGSGRSYVIFGKATGFASFSLDAFTSAMGFTITGDGGLDWAGYGASAAGDVNKDGFDDLLIGAPFDTKGGDSAGESYVIFGHAGTFGNINLSSLAPSVGFRIQGASGDISGRRVSGAGDINGDGYADLIISTDGNDSGGTDSGGAWLIFGHAGGFGTINLAAVAPSQGFFIRGDNAQDFAGSSVSAAGDVNNDGYDDILVGAPDNDSGGTGSGAAYVIFGRNGFSIDANNDVNGDGRSDFLVRDPASGWLATWSGSANGGFTFNSSNSVNIPATWTVVGTGDFDGDGRDDVLARRNDGYISDWLANPGGGFTDNGPKTAYLFTADWKVAGTGDFNGDGWSDFLLRRDDGWLTYWRGQPNGSFTAANAGTSLFFTPDWKIVSTGDFNGDGISDLLLRRDDGWITNWLGTTTAGFTNNSANATTFLAPEWKIAGSGDINGDGRDDLILRRDDGWVTDWLGTASGGFTNNGANASLFFAPEWKIAGIGDINGDGREDMLLRRDDGWVTSWLANANAGFVSNSANFSTFIATNWLIQDPLL